MDIGNRRELFIDEHVIDTMTNARAELSVPQPAGSAITFENPWEGRFCGAVTVLHLDGTYHMYYRGWGAENSTEKERQVTCYARSFDAVHWDKPVLEMHEIDGSKRNNIILFHPEFSHNFAPFVDTSDRNVGGPFKAVAGTIRSGLHSFESEDGIHWKETGNPPIVPPGDKVHALDTHNLAFWSEAEDCYVCMFRSFQDGYRAVGRVTSKDFVSWTEPRIMEFSGGPREHIYTNQTHPYFRAPHIYISLAGRFVKGQRVLDETECSDLDIGKNNGSTYCEDVSETVLMTSRGGYTLDRTFLQGFIKPGMDRRNWVSRCNYSALGIVPTGEHDMSMFCHRHYTQPSGHVERLTLPYDRFAGVTATIPGGEMLTKPFRFSGSQLSINYATGASGHVHVEVCDESGKPIPGYDREAVSKQVGDEVDRTVAWTDKRGVETLAGQTVRLRFFLYDASVYAFRFFE